MVDLEVLSQKLHDGLIEFRELVKPLGSSALRRILIDIVEYPVEHTSAIKDGQEKVVANVARDLKSVMIHLSLGHLANESEKMAVVNKKTTKKPAKKKAVKSKEK